VDLNQVKRFYHTLKNLKITQVYHQSKYRLLKPKRKTIRCNSNFSLVHLSFYFIKPNSLIVNDDKWTFDFLNLKKTFNSNKIEWSFEEYGMLWTYNLNYFDWLNQADMNKELGLESLGLFYDISTANNPIILHPYPTSLRIINTAKFISKWEIKDNWLYNNLLSDLHFLNGRLEFHLLGNHLLENAFGLYIGGLIAGQKKFTERGKNLINKELDEQIFQDGMHYERSPMYHLIIFERLLDALNFASAANDDLLPFLKYYAIKMTGLALNWEELDRIPMMQDSAYGIAMPLPHLLDYSKRLLLDHYPTTPRPFKESNYRRLVSGNFLLIANIGSIGPDYQPGHAHADELNFELFFNGKPLIVDVGVSTYEKNTRRQLERSTSSHNCVNLVGNSSDVWSGFRVGKRARVSLIADDPLVVIASHDGYNKAVITREFNAEQKGEITITDTLTIKSEPNKTLGEGRLHFEPNVRVKQLDEYTFLLNEQIELLFQTNISNGLSLKIEEFDYAQGYNNLVRSKVIVYSVREQITVLIREIIKENSFSNG